MQEADFKRYWATLALPLIAAAGLCAGLVAWDPLDIRPWGPTLRLAQKPYPLLIRPLLAPTMTRNPKSVVLFGSSTVLAVAPRHLNKLARGGAVANVAQGQQRVADSVIVLRHAARTPGLQRMVFEVSHIWLFPNEAPLETGKRVMRAYDPAWYDLPSFDRDIIRAGLAARTGEPFWNPDWDDDVERFAPEGPVELEAWQRDQVQAALNTANGADFSSAHSPSDCDGLEEIEAALRDAIIEAQSRGYALDVFFSAVPFASYPYMAERQRGLFSAYGYEEPFFDKLMALHYCVVRTVEAEGYDGAMVHDVNLDEQIVGDLRGMRDPLHYVMSYKFDRMFERLALRQSGITTATFADYRSRLSSAIRMTLGQPLPPYAPPFAPLTVKPANGLAAVAANKGGD